MIYLLLALTIYIVGFLLTLIGASFYLKKEYNHPESDSVDKEMIRMDISFVSILWPIIIPILISLTIMIFIPSKIIRWILEK